MSSKKHKKLTRIENQNNLYYEEEYKVYFMNGVTSTVYVKVQNGDNEKNHHLEALKIAQKNYPNLEVAKVIYC